MIRWDGSGEPGDKLMRYDMLSEGHGSQAELEDLIALSGVPGCGHESGWEERARVPVAPTRIIALQGGGPPLRQGTGYESLICDPPGQSQHRRQDK
eukprot:13405725-Alexandrium_andersonii.AAC.1